MVVWDLIKVFQTKIDVHARARVCVCGLKNWVHFPSRWYGILFAAVQGKGRENQEEVSPAMTLTNALI